MKSNSPQKMPCNRVCVDEQLAPLYMVAMPPPNPMRKQDFFFLFKSYEGKLK